MLCVDYFEAKHRILCQEALSSLAVVLYVSIFEASFFDCIMQIWRLQEI